MSWSQGRVPQAPLLGTTSLWVWPPKLFVELPFMSFRQIRRTHKGTIQYRDLKFFFKSNLKGNKCRKKWQSLFEKGNKHFVIEVNIY